jgi:hypothetical protein
LINQRWILPADVLRDQDGEIVKIGTAYRSRSGRALIIRVTDAPGDLSVPWRCLVDLISGITQAAPISILIPPPRPSPAPVMNSNPITAGLARGF